MLKTPLGRLRLIGLIEGSSFVILLLIAMPLKYFANLPKAVMVVGWIHGLLFMIYGLVILHVWVARNWPITRVLLASAAALVPLGPFLLDPSLRREQESLKTLPPN